MSSVSEEAATDLRLKTELAAQLHDEMKAQSAWMAFWHNAVAEKLGLNPTDHKCLDLIIKAKLVNEEGQMTPSALAKETNLTTGAVTGVLDRLERAGFVCREHDPEDRRRVFIRPTLPRIETEVAPIFQWLRDAFAEQCSRYTEDELRLLIDFARDYQQVIRTATERLRALEEPPPAAGD